MVVFFSDFKKRLTEAAALCDAKQSDAYISSDSKSSDNENDFCTHLPQIDFDRSISTCSYMKENIFEPNVMEAEEEWGVQNRATWTPFQYFSQYFHDSFWDVMAEQSNIIALQDQRASASGYKNLLGSSIIMGCTKLPRIRIKN